MSTLEMLDVAIGIVFTFLLLSLICTAIVEFLEALMKKRATDLEKGIAELLSDPQPNKTTLLADLYNHSMISGLYKGVYQTNSKNLPSYIPAKNFALALLDVLLPATSTNLSGSAGGGVPSVPGTTVPFPATSITLKSLLPLRTAILNLNTNQATSKLGNALLTLVDTADDDINKVKTNIENWYNTSMDRVSGWYKRRTQWILLLLGFLLAVAMNADTIAIYKSLLNDPPLRSSMVSAAQEYAKTATSVTDTTSAETRVKNNVVKLNELRLPIGWDWQNASDSFQNKTLAVPDSPLGWVLKVIGWLITALAVSLGAPFWFDILNKIMIVRSTVKPHQKSPEEDSEDQ